MASGRTLIADALDARRSMYNQTPEAQYPDGYLGTINTRRGDRLLDNLKGRQGANAPTSAVCTRARRSIPVTTSSRLSSSPTVD